MASDTITIYGYSDDLIEVDGSIKAEFNSYEKSHLVFSTGTHLTVEYTNNGCWRIKVQDLGHAKIIDYFEDADPDGEHSEKLTLQGDFQWVVCGGYAKRKTT